VKLALLFVIPVGSCLGLSHVQAQPSPAQPSLYDGVYQIPGAQGGGTGEGVRDGNADKDNLTDPSCGHGHAAWIRVERGNLRWSIMNSASIGRFDVTSPIRNDGAFNVSGPTQFKGPSGNAITSVITVTGQFSYDPQSKKVTMSAHAVNANGYCKWTYRLNKLPETSQER
jgi:hypothetical protein